MAELTLEELQQFMAKSANIRNVSVIGHVGHGKSTVTDNLVSYAGINTLDSIHEETTEAIKDNQETQTTVKSRPFSLLGRLSAENVAEISDAEGTLVNSPDFLINLIDNPGHTDFFSEVSTSLRISDGAIMVVSAIEGVSGQTERVLQKALSERIKPVLYINKIDSILLESSKEDTYQIFSRIIAQTNTVISTFQDPKLERDWQVSPHLGNVAFGSARGGWAFSIRTFAARYVKKFGIDKTRMMGYLWGNNWFNTTSMTWSSQSPNEGAERAFNQLILDPVLKIYDLVKKANFEAVFEICQKLDIKISNEEKESLNESNLIVTIMARFLPASEALLDMTIIHLPSPQSAQIYRMEILCEGPTEGDEIYDGIRNCSSKTPLVFYVAKMIPVANPANGRFYAFGRVFGGTLKDNIEVKIQRPSSVFGKKEEPFVTRIQSAVYMMASSRRLCGVKDVPAGNIVGLVGVDRFLTKPTTISTSEPTYNLIPMRVSNTPVLTTTVDVKNASDLLQLVKGLKILSKAEFGGVSVSSSNTGQHLLAGGGELHLSTCLKSLEEQYCTVPLNVPSSPLDVQYRETVSTKPEKDATSKSPNNQNRIFFRAEPIGEDLTGAIESNKLNAGDYLAMSRTLVKDFGWNAIDSRKVWTFGPNVTDPNILVDITKGVRYLHEVKDSVVSGFQWATKEGPLSEEPTRSLRFNITDMTLGTDEIARGGDQIIPTVRRVVHASFLMSEPNFMEPFYLAEIQAPESAKNGVYDLLAQKDARVVSEQISGCRYLDIRAFLPVRNSFGLTTEISKTAYGRATSQLTFGRWQYMTLGNPLDTTSRAHELALSIRKKKGLALGIPNINMYHDEIEDDSSLEYAEETQVANQINWQLIAGG
ncbi:Elongation factor 2 [Orbilia ellipsospora]|uniref:Elongation factor 2 n=1 Tax=Orbilia ellipsospora TaxID=2528407 RepID=A0AAV9XAD6_9PEZI